MYGMNKPDWLQVPLGYDMIKVLGGVLQPDDEPSWELIAEYRRPKPLRKMTWSEIEHELGYGVELVNVDDLP